MLLRKINLAPFRNAISRLKADGIPFDFILVEDLPSGEARRLYERADLLIDQLLLGWYGGLAVELMALGKPVIGYVRSKDLKFVPSGLAADMPIINSTPTNIYQMLKQHLTVRVRELSAIDRRSRAFVAQWHDPLRIAARLRKEYETILSTKHGTPS